MPLVHSLALLCGVMATQSPDSPVTPRVFDAGVYGARSDGSDAGPALRRAIDAAAAHAGPSIVRIPPGAFRVAPAPGETSALPVRGARDVAIEGAGEQTLLEITDPHADGVRFQECAQVRLARLRIGYDPPPFAQGTVVGVTREPPGFTLRLDDGYLEPDDPAFDAAHPWGLVVERAPSGRQRFGPIPVWAASPVWQDGLWRFAVDSAEGLDRAGLRPGARYVHMARTMSTAAFCAWKCVDVDLEDVTIHAAPSLATLWGMNENVSVRGLRVARPGGAGRLLSTNADGIHCLGNRGSLRIEGCSFEGMADDAINIHARVSSVIAQPMPNQLVVNEGGCVEHRPGDRVQIYDPEAGRIRYGNVAVTAVERIDGLTRLTLASAVEDVDTGENSLDADHVFNLDACGAGAVIRGNVFHEHRGRAILLKTTDARIEDNIFRNMEGWSVTLHQLQDWGEGPAAQRIRIRGNTFDGRGASGNAPCIHINPSKRGNTPAEGRPVRDVRIEGNRFIAPGGHVLRATSFQGVEMAGNLVDIPVGAGSGTPLISLANGGGFRLDGLEVTGEGADARTVLRIGEDVDPGEAGAAITHSIAADASGAAMIEDARR